MAQKQRKYLKSKIDDGTTREDERHKYNTTMSELLSDGNNSGSGYDKIQHPSINHHQHKRFNSPTEYINELGGSKSFVIEKILIANNGVGAVKAIRSMRKWCYEVFGNERAIKFIVMATPEDLRYVSVIIQCNR